MEAGIVFAVLISGMFVARLRSFAADSELSQEALRVVHQNDVKKMQLALQDRGQYSGQVDGVIGLRTRASIRAFQKAENLPATGLLDTQTALKLGSNQNPSKPHLPPPGRDVVGDRRRPATSPRRVNHGLAQAWLKAEGESVKLYPRTTPIGAAPDDRRGHREEGLRAEN